MLRIVMTTLVSVSFLACHVAENNSQLSQQSPKHQSRGLAGSNACSFEVEPTIVDLNDSEQLYAWEGVSQSTLQGPALGGKSLLMEYQSNINELVGDTGPLDLLRRQRDLYLEFFGEKAGIAYDQIIAGELGQIEATNCLMSLLFEIHLSRLTSVIDPAEFQAIVLESPLDGTWTILAAFGKEISPPKIENLIPMVESKRAEGYSYRFHIHNHPFVFGGGFGDIGGVLIPSGLLTGGADLDIYNTQIGLFGMEKALISNGFDSIIFSAEDISSFEIAFP
ncbi:MAG: hypothetical protein HRU19_23165 [Pseudobacteriovorax sp.]|nr:hypothetical protein [Pseudobacteriovorax sp.]